LAACWGCWHGEAANTCRHAGVRVVAAVVVLWVLWVAGVVFCGCRVAPARLLAHPRAAALACALQVSSKAPAPSAYIVGDMQISRLAGQLEPLS